MEYHGISWNIQMSQTACEVHMSYAATKDHLQPHFVDYAEDSDMGRRTKQTRRTRQTS